MGQIKGDNMDIVKNNDLKTPYYLIDENELDVSYKKMEEALSIYWPNSIIGYSYKTNALPYVISHFNRLGAYAEVVSEDEYELAKLIGVAKEKIIYNGPIKTKESFFESLKNGCYVNIDSKREIDWLDDLEDGDYNIGIRVNFDIEKICQGQSQCGDEGGRFGFCYENGELKKAIDRIEKSGKKLKGIHLHVSSKTRGLDIYKAAATIACKLKNEYDLKLSFIDIGGGFFGGLPTKPQFTDYFSLIADILKTEFDMDKTRLIVEPGMSLIGSPVSYVTSVIDVKDTSYNRFIVTDGTRTSIDPLMTKTSYFSEYDYIGDINDRKILEKQVISGYTCMEHDRLFIADNKPELMVGDHIIYNKVGAYTICLTPLFIKYFPEVYVKRNADYIKVRNRWSKDQYVMESIFENF